MLWDVKATSSLTKVRPQTQSVLFVSCKLTGNAVFLYALDALPLLLAIVVYIPWWPTKYIGHEKREGLEMNERIRP